MQLFDPEHPPTGQVRAHADPVAGTVARDAALASVAGDPGLGLLVAAVCAAAVELGTFTADDVWLALGDQAEVVREPRAIGAAMHVVAGANIIEATDTYRPSVRPSRHRGPVRVWRASPLVHAHPEESRHAS